MIRAIILDDSPHVLQQITRLFRLSQAATRPHGIAWRLKNNNNGRDAPSGWARQPTAAMRLWMGAPSPLSRCIRSRLWCSRSERSSAAELTCTWH